MYVPGYVCVYACMYAYVSVRVCVNACGRYTYLLTDFSMGFYKNRHHKISVDPNWDSNSQHMWWQYSALTTRRSCRANELENSLLTFSPLFSEALILDIDEATPYTSLCLDRGPPPQEDVHDFGFSVLPCGETYYRNKSSRRISPPSSHNSLRVVTRQNSEETKNSASGATLKFRSHLAIHKHEPINTSTGSSTSGVEISSLSSNSGIPNGATLPRMNSSSKLLYQPSYDPDDFLGPEDFENPLFIYRSLSFRRAIEEGNSTQNPNRDPQQHLSFVGTPSNAKQRALKECQQDSSSYFHVSQDSGHAQSLSLGSSLSIDGRFQAHLPSQSSLPLTDEPRAGAKVSLCYRPPSLDPFGSQDESIDRFVWKSFTSEDSGFDPIQILGTDLIADSSEDPFCRNSHLAVELR